MDRAAVRRIFAEAWTGPEVVRLTELHASAVEDHAIELIAERRWAEAVAELQAHIAVHPLRDRPRGLLLQAPSTSCRAPRRGCVRRPGRSPLASASRARPGPGATRSCTKHAPPWTAINRIKRNRAGATRYDKLTARYEATVRVATTNEWLLPCG